MCMWAPAKPKFLERLINGVSRPRLGKNGKGCSDEGGSCLRLQHGCDCDCDCRDVSSGNVVCTRRMCLGSDKSHQSKCIGPCCTSALIGSSSAKGGNKRSLKWHQQQTVCLSTEHECVCSQPTSPTSDDESTITSDSLQARVDDYSESRSAPASPNCPGRSRFYVDSTKPISPSKRNINRRVELLKRLPQRNVFPRDQKFSHTIMASGYVKAMIEMINHTDSSSTPQVESSESEGSRTPPRCRRNAKSITESPLWNHNSFVQQIQHRSSLQNELSPNNLRSCDSSSENGHDNDTGFNSAAESHVDDQSESSKPESGERSDLDRCFLIGANGVPQSPAELFDNSWSDSENIFESDFSDDSEAEDKQVSRPGFPNKQDDEPDPEDTHPGDKLYKIVHELVKTERAYVSRLHLVDQVFHFRVTLENNAANFLPADVIPQMFSNIKSIYQFHHEFVLPKLEERLKDWDNTPRIGDLMKRNAPFLKLYTDYVKNFDNAMALINQWYEKSPKFAMIMQEIQKLPECGSLSLQHHMLEPVQRVPRYELLLKDYMKHLPKESPDQKDTEDAIQLVTKAAIHSNEAMKKIEKFRKLLEIHQSLGGANDLISPTRELIKEGRITKISARREKTQERYIILFNDLLLICSEQILGTFKVRAKLDVDGMEIMEGDNNNIPFTFKVTSKQKIIEFQASSLEESDAWKSALWSVVRDFTRRKESLRMGQSKHLQDNVSHTQDDSELGKRAPEWIKDEAVTMCMICSSAFTTFRRRHHCRACGIVVCSKCSSKKVTLTYDDKGSNRVCDNCHKRLKTDSNSPSKPNLETPGKKKKILQVKGNDPSVLCDYLSYSVDKGKSWSRRWIAVHRDFVMYFFKAHQDICAMNTLPLPGYEVKLMEDELDKPNVFVLYHKNQTEYCFHTEDKIKANKWLKVLEKLVVAEIPEDAHIARLSSDSDNSDKSEKSELSEKTDDS
ncbi:FYVE, RhoGEF and PH domain-containing protein 2-like isoform X2 [Liolophura sinensis]|uniref:FYVE, RhoGEF and PH domain-containing protein 2-like isoform X2 n=1 Tax=Liolophura sinensis TaxID=3198878 RepID=UPI003158C0C1